LSSGQTISLNADNKPRRNCCSGWVIDCWGDFIWGGIF
jgi:hypothetical protein